MREKGDGDRREGWEAVVAAARGVAREHGYGLGVHGSLVRDIDLIAVPWRENASQPEVLIEAIRVGLGGYWKLPPKDVPEEEYPMGEAPDRPYPKPHGRLAWSIYGILGTYLDVSVMPPLVAVTPNRRS